MKLLKFFRSFLRKGEKGAVAIEFGIVVPLLFILISGLFDLGLLLIAHNQINNVLNVGVLYAVSNPTNQAGVQTAMNNASSVSGITSTVTSSCVCLEGIVNNCSIVCNDGTTAATYFQLTASKNVAIIGLFSATNPYPITHTVYIRTK